MCTPYNFLNDAEVTTEMMEAGLRVLAESGRLELGKVQTADDWLVRDIFLEMLRHSKSLSASG